MSPLVYLCNQARTCKESFAPLNLSVSEFPPNSYRTRGIQRWKEHLGAERSEENNENLRVALGKKDYEQISHLLSWGESLNVDIRHDGCPLIFWAIHDSAIHDSALDVVETLLKRDNIDVDFTDDNGRTLMSWIVSFNSSHEVVGGFRDPAQRRIAGLLYQKSNSLLNHPDKDGRTPLSWAAEKGDPYVVKWLLDQPGIELNSKCKSGRTPLFWALSNCLPFGSLSDLRVRYLLETPGIEKHSWDNKGRTLLSWAAGSAQEQAVDYLLADDNIDVNVADDDGWTPLTWATMEGKERIVERLLASKHRVDVNLADKKGQTPLFWAVQEKHHLIVDMLLSRDLVTLCSAVRNGDLAMVKSLVGAGYDVKRTNLLNQTPLHSAILSGNYEIAEFLLSRTTAINGGDNEGMTPLRSAIQQRRVDLVALLLKHSAETKEIKLYEWFEGYNLTGSFYVCLTENGGEKTLSVARVNEIASSNEAIQGPQNRSSERRFFLFKNSLPWQKGLIRDSIEILQPNKLHLSESVCAGDGKHFVLSAAILLFPWHPDQKLGGLLIPDKEECRITWTIRRGVDARSEPVWVPLDFFSTLQNSGTPEDGAELFTQFLDDLERRWLGVCDLAEEHLSNCRLEQLEHKGSNLTLIDCLAVDARQWAEFRKILKGHAQDARSFAQKYCQRYNGGRGLERIRESIDRIEKRVNERIHNLDQTVRDLLQLISLPTCAFAGPC
ncbi:ankyrin repeat-containing domain protein [Fusarium oxysporum II5]|uniref:Uncharacterized protein n=1 Tax=Fusarium odoratissimum (strain NRRL 54006) TaxID=1089451 RepID=X0KCE6_FUSO5|nr:uncharacterized protein FOIG_12500 [Fusarium odoratissimum NRRL 54006]EXL94654.1 hypothetical protein FOIG_12500 [Fusarium odoratissimum NRRL 54006]KAK2128903.1 ankyrin repeat-containing domain protein [Fusarium oxysporum II5]